MVNLKLRNVYKTYPNGSEAVRNFNIDIKDREFIIFVGPSGCGKSTTLRMIAGLESITSGEIEIDGMIVNEIKPKDRDIAMVFQNYGLYPHMTVYSNIAFGLKLRKLTKDQSDREVREVAEILNISGLLFRKPRSLSGGQRQRVAIGRALVRKPKILLMDEPLSNLDAKLRDQMRGELVKIHNETATTVILVTHDQTEAMTLGTRIVVMNEGLIQQIDTPSAIFNRPKNKFVATFIGSPQMNLINAMVKRMAGETIFELDDGTVIKPMKKHGERLAGLGYEGKEIVIGIRPEDIHEDQVCVMASPDTKVRAHVDRVEILGSDTFLHFMINDTKLIARTTPGCKVQINSEETFVFDPNKLHYFDKVTDEAIY